MNILVIDGEPSSLKALVCILARAGWEVTTARSGQIALDYLEKQDFDVVLSDLVLGPGPSGIDVLRLRALRNAGARFIMLTGFGSEAACRQAFLAGAVDFLAKPIGARELIARLAAAACGGAISSVPVSNPPSASSAGLRRVLAAQELIEKRFSELDLTVNALADAVGVTPEYLARVFHVHASRSPLTCLHEMRLREAQRLLDATDLSIYEIARNCGYHSIGELGRRFRRQCKCSPTEFRAWRRSSSRDPVLDHPSLEGMSETDASNQDLADD